MRTILAVLLVATAASAAPLASVSKDIDGDGTTDKIELDAGGELRVETKRGATKAMVTGKLVRPVLSGASVKGTPTIVVMTADEGIALQLAGNTWKQVVRTQVGGVGLDADYGVALDANADGIYRYQTRAYYRRCDGKPAYLFAERFEGGKFVAVAKLPIDVPANVPVIAARVDTNKDAIEPLAFKARVASHQPGAPDAGALAIPQELDDGKPTTWQEDLASAGEGHFFTYTARLKDAKATHVRIVPGRVKNANRLQRLAVVSAQGAWRIDLPDAQKDPAGTAYIAELPTPIASCVTVVIESTYGPPSGKTAFVELQVLAENERSGGSEASIAQAIAKGNETKSAAQALAQRGAAGVTAVEAELAKQTDAAARSRLVRALADNRDPSAGPVLARAVTQGMVTGADLLLAIKALAGLGQGQELHDLAARPKLALEARIAAVRALSPTIEKERDLLVALAGRGPRELRQTVIEKLTDVPVATLAPLASTQPKATAAGDLWRAITRRAHAKAEERAPALAALTAALSGANDYERRYRLVDGIAAVGDAAALGDLRALLGKLAANAQTAAFKQVAARAIAVNPRSDAHDLLVSLVGDVDPGVRLAALSAIAGSSGGNPSAWADKSGPDGIDRVITTRLMTDTWPEVRRYAAQVLGARCTRPGPAAALADSLARDPDLGVRGDALAALVDCKAPSAPGLLEKLWNDSKAPIELRQRAVDLTVVLADRALGQKLVAKYKQWRGAAIESAAALTLAQNAAYAIGRLRAGGAAEALTAALDDSAFPELVSSGAAGLGLLGTECPKSVVPKLKALAKSDEQQVQIAASRAVELCGK